MQADGVVKCWSTGFAPAADGRAVAVEHLAHDGRDRLIRREALPLARARAEQERRTAAAQRRWRQKVSKGASLKIA